MNSTEVSAHLGKYSVAYLLAFLLAAAAGLQGFIEVFEKLTRAEWDARAWWQILALFAKPLVPVTATLIAFFNRSIERAEKGVPHVVSETHTDTKSVSP